MADLTSVADDEGDNIFETKWAGWMPPELVVPAGLTREQIDDAGGLVYDWFEAGCPFTAPLVLEIWAVLSGDASASRRT